MIFSTFLFIGCFVLTEPLVKMFASGFEGKTLTLAVKFTRITLVSMYAYSAYLYF